MLDDRPKKRYKIKMYIDRQIFKRIYCTEKSDGGGGEKKQVFVILHNQNALLLTLVAPHDI